MAGGCLSQRVQASLGQLCRNLGKGARLQVWAGDSAGDGHGLLVLAGFARVLKSKSV